jgi:flagellar assembly factor FliW
MRAIETMELEDDLQAREQETVIHFEEGLIGFADFKHFSLQENDYLAPFRLLKAVESKDVGFLVLDPTTRTPDYCHMVPDREWESVGMTDVSRRLAFVTVVLGATAEKSTANFQAPLLVNYDNMTGKQVILTDSPFSVREKLV